MNKIPVTCLGCGAPLHGPVCEFCGREYDLNEKWAIQGDLFFDRDKYFEVTFMGKKLKMYLSNIEIEPIHCEPMRTLDGRLTVPIHHSPPNISITLTSL